MDNVVYFIRREADGLIKIGLTCSIARRLITLQTGSASPLTVLGFLHGGRQKERELHIKFATDRVHGEWFTASSQLTQWISRHALVWGGNDMPEMDACDFSKLAAIWAADTIAEMIADGCLTQIVARRRLASFAGVNVGLIENLGRGRILAITARDFDAMRRARVRHISDRITLLENDLASVVSSGNPLPGQKEVDEGLSRLKSMTAELRS